jgi:hypothetical protein
MAEGPRPGSENYLRLKGIMKDLKLNTVCEDAHCPNIGECWHHGTATFMILGDVCTRACAYCAVAHGKPSELDRASRSRGRSDRAHGAASTRSLPRSIETTRPTVAPASLPRPSASRVRVCRTAGSKS